MPFSKSVLILFSTVCLFLLFVGGPEFMQSRSMDQAWDMGHVLLFTVWSWCFLYWLVKKYRFSFRKNAALLLLFGFLIGGGIELAQMGFEGRTSSLGDLTRDLIGCVLTIGFSRIKMKPIPRSVRLVQMFGIGLLIWSLVPLCIALVDEQVSWSRFPLLADFETPFEADRFGGDAIWRRDQGQSRSGKYALRIELDTTTYSGLSLKYFKRDWRGFRTLAFSVYNASDNPLQLSSRIHDRFHSANGNQYKDRFNTRFNLQPGWNDLEINLAHVRSAPKYREMDMEHIAAWGIFVIRQEVPRLLYLDNIRLNR
jgi:hypothetical protein